MLENNAVYGHTQYPETARFFEILLSLCTCHATPGRRVLSHDAPLCLFPPKEAYCVSRLLRFAANRSNPVVGKVVVRFGNKINFIHDSFFNELRSEKVPRYLEASNSEYYNIFFIFAQCDGNVERPTRRYQQVYASDNPPTANCFRSLEGRFESVVGATNSAREFSAPVQVCAGAEFAS